MREQDIRPADVFAQYLELTASDAKTYFSAPDAFEEVPCPGCGGAQCASAFEKEGFRYVECVDCGTLFVSPRPTRSALDRFYLDSPSATYWADVFFPTTKEARRSQIFVPRVERVLGLVKQWGNTPSRVIDVGAGYGLFLEEYRARQDAAEVLAIEPGAKLAAVCRAAGIETLQKPVEDASEWEGRGDLVVCFEVLEHVYSTYEFARALARLVAPRGRLLVTSLTVDGFDIQVLWERSRSVSPPHHLNFLSLDGYRRLFERAGLSDIDVFTPGQLDVDIVRNSAVSDPAVIGDHRFLRTLMSRRSAHVAFQRFLAENSLSSHVWILAHRPHAAG